MNKTPFYRSRKTLIATSVTLVLGLSASGAFAWGNGHRDAGQRFDYIFSQLSLTEEQASQVQDIFRGFALEQHEAMKQRKDEGGERPSREEMEALHAQKQTQLADRLGTVLQPTQVEELMTYLNAHAPRMGHRGKMGGPGHCHQQSPQTETQE